VIKKLAEIPAPRTLDLENTGIKDTRFIMRSATPCAYRKASRRPAEEKRAWTSMKRSSHSCSFLIRLATQMRRPPRLRPLTLILCLLFPVIAVSTEVADPIGDPDSLRTFADSLRALGKSLLENEEYLDASSTFEQEIELRKGLADTVGWCAALNAAAEACLRGGSPEHVIAFTHQAVALWSRGLEKEDTILAKSYTTLGIVYDNIGEYSLALQNLKKALGIRLAALGPDHLDVAATCNSLGIVYGNLGSYEEALESHKRALAIWSKVLGPEHPFVGAAYGSIGIAYRNLGAYELALENHELALKIQLKTLGPKHPEVASTYNNLGIVYLDLGLYDQALLSHNRALTIQHEGLGPDHPEVAKSYANIGEVYRSLGAYEKALANHTRAIAIFSKVLGPDHPYLAGACNNIAIVYGELGEYQKALESYERALAIQLKALGPDHPSVALCYNNIGNVYDQLGDYTKALENLNAAFRILVGALGSNHTAVAATRDNIANVYFNLGKFEEALENYRKALEIRSDILGPNHPDVAVSYYNIARVHQELGDFEGSLENHKKALEIFRQTVGERHPDAASSYNKIGNVYEELGRYDEALRNYRKALAIRLEVLGPQHPHTGVVYHNIGYVYRYQGEYDSAIVYFQKSIDIFERSRSKIESAELRAAYTETVSERYEAIICLLMDMGRPQEAFEYLERSKSKALQAALAERYEIEVGKGELREKIKESKNLAKQVETLETQLLSERVKPDSLRNKTRLESLSQLLAQTKAEYFKVAAEIQADPDYAFAVKVDPVQIGTIRQDIPPGEKLLMSYSGKAELYLFLVSREGYEVRSVPVSRNHLDSLITCCRELCGVRHINRLNMQEKLIGWSWEDDESEFYRNEVAPLKSVLRELDAYLIEPFARELASAKVVTIIPSGNLYYVPWGGLLYEEADSLRFLSQRYNWHVMTSAELLKCIQRRETDGRPRQPGSLLLVGNPEGTNLPCAQKEVAAIGAVYPNSTTFTGPQATEEQVVGAAPKSQVLHLATHCRLDAQNPWESYIQLAPTRTSDGRWSVAEISGESWDSMQLVALSGCETALGGARPGLEFESVAKAFSLAMEGPPSIVATLWPVEDESTKELMVAFYEELKHNPKSEALRRAQTRLISSDRYAHPFFWAPFILIGEYR